MNIASIYVSGLLGVRTVDVRCPRRIQLFAGKNHQGKSSIADAVRLALCAEFGRGVNMKKDAALMVSDSADSAVCEVVTADGDSYKVAITKAGKISDSFAGKNHDPRLPYVLDAQRLPELSPTERQKFLASVLDLPTDHTVIQERLIARGLDPDRVKRIAPLLRMGFTEAQKDAAAKASEARGAWKNVAGSNYGSVKAKTWRADAPAFDVAELDAMQAQLAGTEESIAEVERSAGALEQLAQQHDAIDAQLATKQPLADLETRRREKLAHDEAELGTWTTKLQQTEQAAGAEPKVGLVHDLARTLHSIRIDGHIADFVAGDQADKVLEAYRTQYGEPDATAGDPEARARLFQVRQTYALMVSAVENARRDLKESTDAAAAIATLTQQRSTLGAVDKAKLDDVREQLAALRGLRKTRSDAVEALKRTALAVAAAAEKTADAAKHHADVVAWEAIAEALSPEGLQAELLAEALVPLNARMAQSCTDLQWPVVEVQADMRITLGGRAYQFLSKSEQWGAAAVLAEAVSHISGLRTLVLDGMDILDPEARGQLIAWLDVLAQTGEVDTVLVMATLRALPADLPDTFDAHWVEGGVSGVPMAAAA